MSYLTNNSLITPIATAWKYRELVFTMSKREVLSRYRGSWFGLFWSLITPILLLLVYMFVFGIVFKARWPSATGVDEGFASLLFCGIVIYMMFSEMLSRAPRLIIDNANYVKKVVFPLDLLSWVAMLSALFHFALSLFVLLAFVIFWGNGITWFSLYIPLLSVIFMVHLIGMAWFVSALGVYIRDVAYIAGFVTTALIFLSPVFYPKSAVPEGFARAMDLNPLTFYIESFRDVVVLAKAPEFEAMGVAAGLAVVSFVVGYWFFNRVRRGFADVL